jgi:flagellar protein FliS
VVRAARAYQSVDRHTAVISGNTVDLVILLYEKLLQRFREARKAIELNDIAGRGVATSKAIELIEKGLIGCLDMRQGGEIAEQLRRQYGLWLNQTLRCNLTADLSLLDKLEAEVKDILSAWQEIKQQPPARVPLS